MTALPRLAVERPAHEVKIGANLEALGYTRQRRRVSLLALVRRPSRTTQRERLLDRYRWANAGLRERLRVEVTAHDATLDTLEALTDDQARILGHAHPLIVGVRSTIAQARVR